MPTFTHGSTAQIWVGDSSNTPQNITSAVSTTGLQRIVDTAEVTALGNTSKAYIAGLKDATFPVDGIRDVTIEGYVDGSLGTPVAFAYLPNGSASGKVKYSGSAICTSYNPNSDVGDANKWSAQYQCTGDITRTVL